MQTAKQAAQQVLGQLSNQVSWDEIMYELYVKEGIEEGLADVKAGRFVSHEQLKAELFSNED